MRDIPIHEYQRILRKIHEDMVYRALTGKPPEKVVRGERLDDKPEGRLEKLPGTSGR